MQTKTPRSQTPQQDQGSITPLVLGMTFGLLFLAAGIIAAGSAFMAHQGLRGQCDGAAAAAANAAADILFAGSDPIGTADQVANDYLDQRNAGATAVTQLQNNAVTLNCTKTAQIVFGDLFGRPTLEISVKSVGRPVFDA